MSNITTTQNNTQYQPPLSHYTKLTLSAVSLIAAVTLTGYCCNQASQGKITHPVSILSIAGLWSLTYMSFGSALRDVTKNTFQTNMETIKDTKKEIRKLKNQNQLIEQGIESTQQMSEATNRLAQAFEQFEQGTAQIRTVIEGGDFGNNP